MSHTDCRSEVGITVSLIDGMIAMCRVIATRNLDDPAIAEALDDFSNDESVALICGLRPEVARFAGVMESRLRQNDHKPGWKQDGVRELIWRLWDEAGELDVATIPEQGRTAGDITAEAADVANFAMMIADVCGGLDA